MHSHDLNRARMARWDPQMRAAFSAWQRDCGLVGGPPRQETFAPGQEPLDGAIFNEHYRAWKESLALEGLVRTDEDLDVQLRMIFCCGGRSSGGDIYSMPHPVEAAHSDGLNVPATLLPSEQAGAMDRLAAPVGREVAAEIMTRLNALSTEEGEIHGIDA